MSSNRNRNSNVRGNNTNSTSSNLGSSNRRTSTSTNSVENKQQKGSHGSHIPSNPPARNAWGMNSIHAAATGSPSLKTGSLRNSNTSTTNSSSTPASSAAILDAQKHMYDRILFLLVKSIGSNAIATVSSGASYKGILVAATAEQEIGIVLALAEKIASAPGEENEDGSEPEKYERLVIMPKDLVDLQIISPNLSPEKTTAPSATATSSSKFKTDTDISGRDSIKERDLEKWQDDSAASIPSGLSLEEVSSDQPWDQFAANEQKFGVQSTYDEHYYTTAINRNAPDFEERERRALRLASEIENSSYGGNIHIAEERGLVIDDSGMDEEDKYSGVQRLPTQQQQFQRQQRKQSNSSVPPARNANAYIPPSSRAPANKPDTKGPPNDPAIVSSRLVQPSKDADSVSSPHLHTDFSHSVGKSTSISALFGAVNQTENNKPTNDTSKDLASRTTNTTSAAATSTEGKKQTNVPPASKAPLPPSVALPAARAGKLSVDRETPSTDVAKDLVGNFKEFVSTEMEKVQQKKHYLHLKEKSDKIHDFKKFSQEFTINAKVPIDLVPILGKRHTQKATPATEESKPLSPAKSAATTTPASTESSANNSQSNLTLSSAISEAHKKNKVPEMPSPLPATKTPQLPQPKSSQASPVKSPSISNNSVKGSPAPTPKLNLNFKAPEFKPNPAAHSFTPSYGSSPSPIHPSAHSSPFISHSSPAAAGHTPRQRNGNLFFGSKPLTTKSMAGKFNMFARLAKEQDKKDDKVESVVIERAFLTLPTWTSSVDSSYKDLIPSQDAIASRPFYGRTPIVPSAVIPPNALGIPSGMMPVMQDPRAMMGSSPPVPSQGGFMAYPQYPGGGALGPVPQYGGPQFFGRPPHQPFPMPNMMAQGYVGFQPQEYHQSHQSPRGPHAVPQMGGQPYGGPQVPFYSPQQQHQFLRSPGPHNHHVNHHSNNHHGGHNNRHRGGQSGGDHE